MAMRALRGARDVYVRGLRGLDRLVAAANPRAGVGRPTSRVFGVGGDRGSEEDVRDLVHAMQARRIAVAASAGAARSEKTEAGASAVRRGGMMLESINEDTAVVHPTSSRSH